MNYDILYTFILATALLACSPGPDNIFVLTQSVAHGKKYGLTIVSGLMTGCLIHTTFVALGFSAIISQSELLFFIIKLFGVLYLLFLAYKVLRSQSAIELSDEKKQKKKKKKKLWELFKQGFIMNVLNPKVSIFFLAFFPGFLFNETMSTATQFYILGLVFIIVSFIVFGLIAILAGHISKYLRGNPKVGGVLKWGQIIVFIGIAIFILFSDK
ncbi:LysE family translocator [Aquimarina pacifica]|uniref:LysE family translocator n=1 Tax=Aquimarina pacifica TaxID=1296415 RepID=UPI00046EB323|nr:LysE family translocator [Aquimarina pacifica]